MSNFSRVKGEPTVCIPEKLNVFSNEGDLVKKQILHQKISELVQRNNLYLSFNVEYKVINQREKFYEYIISHFSKLGEIYCVELWSCMYHVYVLNDDYIIDMKFSYSNKSDVIEKDFGITTHDIKIKEKIKKELDEILKDIITTDDRIYGKLWYKASGELRKGSYPINLLDPLPNVNYPYIVDIEKYIDKYLESESPILILYGKPGTGKTRFIRRLLTKMTESKKDDDLEVYMTSDDSILSESQFFSSFLESDSDAMVIEDMDLKLGKRTALNNSMNYLLNLSDGLIDIKNKKMIFSTNLSIKEIDEALIRKGRCFDFINFRALNNGEKEKFFEYHMKDKKFDTESLVKNEYTLAELYALKNNDVTTNNSLRSIGFN